MNWNGRTFREAKLDIHDEFYTKLSDIEEELIHYWPALKGKTVYCPCDDPWTSKFVLYFLDHFSEIGLKRLIATSWTGEEMRSLVDLFNEQNQPEKPKRGKLLDTARKGFSGTHYLEGNGDFRSVECSKLMDEADVIITNPPFSLFRDLVMMCAYKGKQMLLLGNNNALICKDIFPLIQYNKLWLGKHCNHIMTFDLPDGTEGKVHGLSWFTNLPSDIKRKALVCKQTYDPKRYPTYVNYPAIECDRLKDIPCDYDGEIGVPITFLCKYDPKQFIITGLGRGQSNPKIGPLGKEFVDNYNAQDSKRKVSPDCVGNLGFWSEGKAVIPYMRVLIKRR